MYQSFLVLWQNKILPCWGSFHIFNMKSKFSQLKSSKLLVDCLNKFLKASVYQRNNLNWTLLIHLDYRESIRFKIKLFFSFGVLGISYLWLFLTSNSITRQVNHPIFCHWSQFSIRDEIISSITNSWRGRWYCKELKYYLYENQNTYSLGFSIYFKG